MTNKVKTLQKIAKENLGKKLTSTWFKKNYPEFFYLPDVPNAKPELDGNLIIGLLGGYGYKVSFSKELVGDNTYRKRVKSITINIIDKKTKNDKEKNIIYKFLKLAKPDDDGKAIVPCEKFEKDKDLKLGNGGSWCRKNSKLAEYFIIELHKDGSGNKNTSIELLGWNREIQFSQRINRKIVDGLKHHNCVFCGFKSKIEIDHKDGRKDDLSFNDINSQQFSYFQPLCKSCNDKKRQACKVCKETNKRWSAANIKEYKDFPFYEGGEDYNGTCVGCMLYDFSEFRKAYEQYVREKTIEEFKNKTL